eukprot:scaffold258678_cov28-Tisochrysis_lutea.AAC.2
MLRTRFSTHQSGFRGAVDNDTDSGVAMAHGHAPEHEGYRRAPAAADDGRVPPGQGPPHPSREPAGRASTTWRLQT